MAFTHVYNHATYVHFHHPLNMKLSTCFQLISTMIIIDITNCATRLQLCKYYSPTFCD